MWDQCRILTFCKDCRQQWAWVHVFPSVAVLWLCDHTWSPWSVLQPPSYWPHQRTTQSACLRSQRHSAQHVPQPHALCVQCQQLSSLHEPTIITHQISSISSVDCFQPFIKHGHIISTITSRNTDASQTCSLCITGQFCNTMQDDLGKCTKYSCKTIILQSQGTGLHYLL